MDRCILGLLLLGLSLSHGKKSHHHNENHHSKKNVTLADLGKVKSTVTGLHHISSGIKNVTGTSTGTKKHTKPKVVASGKSKIPFNNSIATGKSTIIKKQSLGIPLNNMEEQGLGGEPVGHLDASEGVGGLGGDQDGIPIGMGAGAEPLGMAKGKEMPPGMAENGGAMQGLGEDSESLHDNEDVTRPFQEQQGDYIEGGRGNNVMNGHSSNFLPGSNNPLNMMEPPNGGMSSNMNNFLSNGDGGGEHGNNFMEHLSDENSYRGPKKDPLGGDIKPFNDEYKNDNGGHMMGNNHGDRPHPVSYMAPSHDEGEEHMVNTHEFTNPEGDLPGNQGDNDIGKSNHGEDTEPNFMGPSNDESSFRGPKKDSAGGDLKAFEDHKNEGMSEEDEPGEHAMSFMGHKEKGNAKPKETKHMGGAESDFANPSPTDIGKALNGNLAALDSVNIQGDGDVAEMVRKATHQKEFTNSETGTFNGVSLMDPGYSSTTKTFFSPGDMADRRTKKGSHAVRGHTKTKVARGKDSKKRHL